MWDGTFSFDKAFEIFESNLMVTLEDDVNMMTMKDVSLVFFPIISHEHFYLIVFNLKRVAFNIIDNSAACLDYDAKYKQIASLVQGLFANHLEAYEHPKASSIRNAKPSILKMKWKTVNNQRDCGVFLMCHMDTYMGESVAKWNPGFVTESSTGKISQRLQLNKLRIKYVTKILLHDLNIHKEKMIEKAKEFEKLDFKEGLKMINEAIKNRVSREGVV